MTSQPNQSSESAHDASQLQGTELPMHDPAQRQHNLRLALDYRGDVTVTQHNGSTITGFLYDLRDPDTPEQEPIARFMLPDGTRLNVPAQDITSLAFTGKDTAAGKSFETWVKKYVKQKLAEQRTENSPQD